MPSKRNITEVIGTATRKQAERAVIELNARRDALGTWDKVAFSLGQKFNPAYLWQVGAGRKQPSRRLLRALGIVKPDKRTGIRVRMSQDEAREIVDYNTIPVNVKNRIRYQMGAK